ncbi:potassium channel family protein [Maricaulis sp.]|jgi:hypothetical protein|uniref:potassium channel family protein n=1 Tax=Maricaulis sp. TaxID=1486257 RepID=UPI00260B9FDB|nr:potassium channel family protein [Maricaulis sp.]
MLQAFLLSAVMVVITTAIHMTGLLGLMALTGKHRSRVDSPGHRIELALFILAIVLGVFLIHALEVFVFALAFLALGEIASFETAVYFSLSTFTTLGMGDIVLDSHWRILVAVEALIGFLMIGWSTAFLVYVLGKLRTLERAWFVRLGEEE